MELILLAWLLGTIILATFACILGRKLGVEYLIGMFVGCIIIANVVATKVIEIGPFTTTAGLVVYSITFLITDSISEFWGRKEAQKTVFVSFLTLLMFVLVTQLSLLLTPASFWPNQEAFEQTLGSSIRVGIASIIAFLVAQLSDVYLFHAIKKITRGKHLWLRNNVSTILSQSLDTLLFVSIAFYGLFPIWQMIIGGLVLKVGIALIDTPFLYLIRSTFRKTK